MSEEDTEPDSMSDEGGEKRKTCRYVCMLQASSEDKTSSLGAWPARVLNISCGGIALHVGEPFDVGTELTIGLHSPSQSVAPIRVRVVHVSEQSNGTWLLGAAFERELSETALQFLLS